MIVIVFIGFIVISIPFISRSLYVATKIKEDPESTKYGKDPERFVTVLFVFGVILFLIGIIGIPTSDSFTEDQSVENPSSVENTESMENNTRAAAISTPLTFETFKLAYNKSADKFSTENIDEWIVEEGEKVDTARSSSEGRIFQVTLSKDDPAYVLGIFFIFPSSSDNQLEIFHSLLKMYALILTLEPALTPEIIPTLSNEILDNTGEKVVSDSGVEYMILGVGGNLFLSISLPANQ
jgi:hypothetical protein